MNFLVNAAISVIAPFFPPLATIDRGQSHSEVGIIFGALPVGSFIFAIFIGVMLAKLGRKKVMLISVVTMVISVTLFGIVYLIKNDTWFFLVSLFSRLI